MEPTTIVIDVPEHATAAEASQALNAAGDGFFLVQVLPLPGVHRAYFRRYKQAPAKETVKTAVAVADDTVALSIVRANREKPIRTIVSLLSAAGITRGRQWVSEQLTATCAEDGREEEALRLLATFSRETPGDAALFMRQVSGVRRTAAWVRQQRERKSD